MLPWGHNNTYPLTYDVWKRGKLIDTIEIIFIFKSNRLYEPFIVHNTMLIDQANQALYKAHGTVYETGTTNELLYVTSGGPRTWAYGKMQIPYNFCTEIRDKGAV